MSGHSKWTQIKHRKSITDQKRGQIFSKLSKLISVAAKEGTNPDSNFKLKSAIDKAKTFNLPNENIERAINKVKEKPESLEELAIEAMGPSNISIIIKVITDNRNRALSEIKGLLTKNNAKLASPGSQIWQFKRTGVVKLNNPIKEGNRQNLVREDFELQLIETGAEEIKKEDETLYIYSKPENLEAIKTALINMELEIESAEIEYISKMPLKIEEDEIKSKINKLFEALDEHEDVEEIYSNLEV